MVYHLGSGAAQAYLPTGNGDQRVWGVAVSDCVMVTVTAYDQYVLVV